MPQVPRYDELQAGSNTLSTARANPARMGEAAGGQAQRMGQGMSDLGQHLGNIAIDMQRKANETVAKDVDAQAIAAFNDAIHNPETGYLTQQGKNAALGLDAAVARINEVKTKALDGVQSQAVRQMLDPVLTQRMQNALDTINRHAGQETRKYQVQAADARAVATLQDAALNYADDARFVEAIAVSREETATLAELNGWDGDTARLRADKYQDDGFRMRYEAWRLHDPAAALAHFQRNATGIKNPLLRGDVEAMLFNAAAPQLAAMVNQAGGIDAVEARQAGNPNEPRGIRNNNPGNIMKGPDKWQGETDGSDPRYTRFATPEAGIRALGKTLLTYQDKHGIDTAEGIAARWAPASENDTASYAAAIARAVRAKPGDPLNLHDPDTLATVTRAIIQVENGKQPYSEAQILAGLNAALGNGKLPDTKASAAPTTNWRDPSVTTGHPVIDALAPDQKMRVLQLAQAQVNQDMAQARESLHTRTQDSVAEYLARGEASNPPTEAEFIRAYGQGEGVRRYQELRGTAALGLEIQRTKALPNAALDTMLIEAKPQPGEGFAARQRNYEALQGAVKYAKEKRQEDPVAYALENPAYGIKPLSGFGNPQVLAQELGKRYAAMDSIARDYGTRPTVMTGREADAFGQYLGSLQAPDKARVLGQVFQAVGPAGVQSVAAQLKDKHDSLAVAAMLSGQKTTEGNNAALLYLQGKEAIEQKRAKIDETPETGIKAEIFKAIDGVYQTPQGREAAAEAALGIYAKFRADGGDDVDQAVNIATGGIMDHNGGRIAKPYGWADSRFRDALKTTVPAQLIKQGGNFTAGGTSLSAADLARFLPAARLQTFGQGSYLIRAGNDVVRDANGQPFVLKVAP